MRKMKTTEEYENMGSGLDARTPLMRAAYSNDLEAVKAFIKKGVDVNIKDTYGDTALDEAFRSTHIEIVKLLIDATKVDLHTQNNKIYDALCRACECGDTEIVKLLIDGGVDPNMQQKNGNTALLYASEKGHTDIVRLLIKSGADVEIGNPLLYAFRSTHIEIVKLLIKAGADVENNDFLLYEASEEEIEEFLDEASRYRR